MDQLLYTRISMAGWLFFASLIATLWAGETRFWRLLLHALSDVGESNTGPVVSILVAGLIGIGGPPAVGFVLERMVSVWTIQRGFGTPSSTEAMEVIKELHKRVEEQLDRRWDKAAFHCLDAKSVHRVIFRNCASEPLIEYYEWQKTQVFASLTSGIAIALGLFIGIGDTILTGTFTMASLAIMAVCGILIYVLRLHVIQHRQREIDMLRAWDYIYGLRAIESTNLGEPERRDGHATVPTIPIGI